MRKATIPLALFLILISVPVINYWLSLANVLLELNLELKQYRYLITIFTYLAVLAVLLLEKDNLSVFNFDRPSLLILVLFGVVRVNLFVPNESWYKTIIATISLTIFLICIVQWRKIPGASVRWAMIGVFVSSIAIPIALIEMLQVEKYAQTMYEKNFTGTLIRPCFCANTAQFYSIRQTGGISNRQTKPTLGQKPSPDVSFEKSF